MGQLFQQAQKMQREMKQVQDDLKKRTVVGEAGGGMVKAYVNGQQEVLKIEIDREAVDPEDLGMLEDLLLVALKNGLEKSRELSKTEMGRVTGGLNLPGLF
jgi:DNA-binding YbaB/EbfC family protein